MKIDGVAFMTGIFNESLRIQKSLHKRATQLEEADDLNHELLWLATRPLLHGAIETGYTLTEIGLRRRLADCYTLSRALLETSINICYLASTDEALQDMLDYSLQRLGRTLTRNLDTETLEVKLTYHGEPLNIEGLDEAIDKYTSKRGRAKTRWTTATIIDRIKAISEIYGERPDITFTNATFFIYDMASEILHGTIAGHMRVMGVDLTKESRDREIGSNVDGDIIGLFVLLSDVVNVTTRILARKLSIDTVEEEVDKQAEQILNVGEKIYCNPDKPESPWEAVINTKYED